MYDEAIKTIAISNLEQKAISISHTTVALSAQGYIVYKNHMVVKNGLISDRDEQYYHYFMYFKMKFINPLIRFFYQKKTIPNT